MSQTFLLAIANKPNTEEIFNPAIPVTLNLMGGVSFLQSLISVAITTAFIIGSVVFFFMLITGAINWITSKGDVGGHPTKDPGPLIMAKKQITNSLIGLALLMVIYVIIRLIKTVFGVDIMEFDIPKII